MRDGIAVFLIIASLVAGTVVGFFVISPIESRSTITVTSSVQSTVSYQDLAYVRSEAIHYITLADQLNGQALSGLYSYDAKSNWTGVDEPWQGEYSGDGVGARIVGMFAHANSFNISYSDFVLTPLLNDSISTSFDLAINMSDVVFGPTTATVGVSLTWHNFEGNWLIVSDQWDFTSWNSTSIS